MNIINQDRAIELEKKAKGRTTNNDNKPKRISAVTMAKIQQKQQIQAFLNEHQSKPSRRTPQGRKLKKTAANQTPSKSRRSLNFDKVSVSSSVSSPRFSTGTKIKARN